MPHYHPKHLPNITLLVVCKKDMAFFEVFFAVVSFPVDFGAGGDADYE